MNGQAIIVFIILLICILWVGYKLFRFFRTEKTKPEKKCDNSTCTCCCQKDKTSAEES
jgi:hypothetical protein